MERDREKCARKPSRRVARLISDEVLTKLEAAVSAGRAPQWQLDLVRSARACADTNT
jgi:hypothetical protein